MTQTSYTIDSANDTGQIDIFIDNFVSRFTYAAGSVTLSEITTIVNLAREEIYFNMDKIREWLDLLVVNMAPVSHPQPAYAFELEHQLDRITFKFEYEMVLTFLMNYDIPSKTGTISPRVEQVLSLRAFSRYVEALELLVHNMRLYKD